MTHAPATPFWSEPGQHPSQHMRRKAADLVMHLAADPGSPSDVTSRRPASHFCSALRAPCFAATSLSHACTESIVICIPSAQQRLPLRRRGPLHCKLLMATAAVQACRSACKMSWEKKQVRHQCPGYCLSIIDAQGVCWDESQCFTANTPGRVAAARAAQCLARRPASGVCRAHTSANKTLCPPPLLAPSPSARRL